MTAPAPIAAVMAAFRTLVAGDARLAGFTALPRDLPYAPWAAHTLPSVATLPRCAAPASAVTAPLVEAVLTAAPYLHWRQSYTAEQVGQDHLDRYGWFNLVAPDGPYVSPEYRISVGFWGAGLHYPRHWHEPEEIYVILAGGAEIFSDAQGARWCGPGDQWHNPPNEPHGMTLGDSALLALAIWRGQNLNGASTLPPETRP